MEGVAWHQHDASDIEGEITASDMKAERFLGGVITGKEIIIAGGVDGIIRSDNFVAGSAGWRILGDGSIEANDIVVRNELISGNVTLSTNGVFRTAASGQRIELTDADSDQVSFYSGHSNETTPGKVEVNSDGYLSWVGPILSPGAINHSIVSDATDMSFSHHLELYTFHATSIGAEVVIQGTGGSGKLTLGLASISGAAVGGVMTLNVPTSASYGFQVNGVERLGMNNVGTLDISPTAASGRVALILGI